MSVRRGVCYGHGGCRGFKLNNSKRFFYVHGIRTRFLSLLRRWKTSYLHALRSLMRRHVNGSSCEMKNSWGKNNHRQYGKNNNYAALHGERSSSSSCDYRLKSFGRSNSFYSEAIADCLDFIKRNSVSLDEAEKPVLISSQS